VVRHAVAHLILLYSLRTIVCYSDYNYVRHDNECTPVGPEPIKAGVCTGNPDQMYLGSSGYRLVPGNTCNQATGVKKDDPISKKCSQGSCYHLFLILESHCDRCYWRGESLGGAITMIQVIWLI
jgi:hypothetical protein